MNHKIEFDGDRFYSAYKIEITEDLNFDAMKVYTQSNIDKINKKNGLIKILAEKESKICKNGIDIYNNYMSRIYIKNPIVETNNKFKYEVHISYLKELGVTRDELNRLIKNPETNEKFYESYKEYVNSVEYVTKDIINKITINEKIKILKDLLETEQYDELEKYIIQKIFEDYDSERKYIQLKKNIENIVFDQSILGLETLNTIDSTYKKYEELINKIEDEEIMNNIKNSEQCKTEEEEFLCLAYIKTVNKVCKDLNLEYLLMDGINKRYNVF
ncbi:hypothetical protein [Paraclostridium sordellii]|uniref:hypothetical protein n=1 Tax=Paraclostridium sordellii TaxID=1505 RepID=UPI001C6154CD|nr:hypothetical protein [Paeniclostridium sordellii]QYE96687.1 hypothetical protein KZ987_10495 [Paeniclostridium sordellii]